MCEKTQRSGSAGDAVSGLGVSGAAVWYTSTAATLWRGVRGFLKALVWPAFLVYGPLKAIAG